MTTVGGGLGAAPLEREKLIAQINERRGRALQATHRANSQASDRRPLAENSGDLSPRSDRTYPTLAVRSFVRM